MTRSERINKLGNAIKIYRGIYNPESGKWIRPPRPQERENVIKWLRTLCRFEHVYGVDEALVQQHLKRIEGFKTRTEYADWVKKLE